MSHTELPAYVDPNKLTEQGASIEGLVPLVQLERVKPLIMEPYGSARVRIAFFRDTENRRVARGEVLYGVRLRCQRCMEPMDLELQSVFAVSFVADDEQARNLPRELEPVLSDGWEVDLWRLVEDEILLSLPASPLHENVGCIERLGADLELEYRPDQEPEVATERPFDVLAKLKKPASAGRSGTGADVRGGNAGQGRPAAQRDKCGDEEP